jgi:hypothetical protein
MTRSSSSGIKNDGRRLGNRIRLFFSQSLHFNKKELGMYVTQKRAAELRKKRWDERDVVDTKCMSYAQRASYYRGFQSDESDFDD